MGRIARLGTFILLILLGACTGPQISVHPTSQASDRHIIIFVPGFKGTSLATPDGNTVWLSLSNALFNGETLALKLPDLGISGPDLRVAGVLRTLSAIPYLYTYDIYGSFLDHLRDDHPEAEVIEVPYDWRMDLMHGVRSLGEVVDRARSTGARITLVGHSLGGLIVAYYLRYGTADFDRAVETWAGSEKIEGALIAGAPFRGSYVMFRDMQFGSTTLFNTSLLNGEALSTFPSSYTLLPHDSVQGEGAMSPLDPKQWSNRNWGLLRNAELPEEIRSRREHYTTRMLTRAALFFEAITREPQDMPREKTVILNIIGSGFQTVSGASLDPESGTLDFDNSSRAEGDGSVTVRSADLPEAYSESGPAQTIIVPCEHGSLLKCLFDTSAGARF